MNHQQTKRRTLWQMLMLAILLIGFPLGSWIYLTKGFNYQMAAREQLRKTHQMPAPDLLNLQKGKLPEVLEGSMYIIALLPNVEEVHLQDFASTLSRLHEQFDLPKNIQFWNIFEGKDSSFVAAFVDNNNMAIDDEQLLYFTVDKVGFNSFTDQLGFNDTELSDRGRFPQIVMVDDSLYIRRIFRTDLENEVKQLVEATALLLPARSKPKARVVRETEK